jgi:hypothetical protein
MLQTGFYFFYLKGKGLPRLCLAMASGFEKEGDSAVVGKKVPVSQLYVCSAVHRETCRNSLTHTLAHLL